MTDKKNEPKILMITTDACSYPGVDNAGQKHLDYSTKAYTIRTLDPVVFSVQWYLEVLHLDLNILILGTFIIEMNTFSIEAVKFAKKGLK